MIRKAVGRGPLLRSIERQCGLMRAEPGWPGTLKRLPRIGDFGPVHLENGEVLVAIVADEEIASGVKAAASGKAPTSMSSSFVT
jgi:hypothetical protein